MRRNLVTMQYFETYYYANVIHNILSEPADYLRHLNDWHVNSQGELFVAPFPKWSLLHSFSAFIIRSLVDEHISDVTVDAIVNDSSAELWVDAALRYHGFQMEGFRPWLAEQNIGITDVNEDHVCDYHQELYLCGELEELVEQLSAEVFFVLFGNRALLGCLNGYVAAIVAEMDADGVEPQWAGHFAKPGQLKRAHIPHWARKAVFFRDRGMCTKCHTDLSGVLTAQTESSYDHIVPLKHGGINDVTNLQLLCGTCNRGKAARSDETSSRYESWY